LKTSIRKYLLIHLLLAITVTTLLTVIGNYFLDKQDIQEHVNSLIATNAISYSILPDRELIDFNQHEEASHQLGLRIILDDLYIMLLTFPLSGLLIWIIIGRGLDSLNRVAIEVSNRAPTHLEPVSQAVPEEIRPLIDELNHLFLRLQDGFEREKRFAADAAHELKTPLAAIKAQAQVALNTANLDEKNKALHKLISSVNRSTHIIQQLLTMSNLVPDNIKEEQDTIEIARIARDTLAMLAPSAIDRQIELEFQQSEPMLCIKGNTTALSILFRNLVDNAIRYSPNHTLVLVRIFTDDHHIIVEVCDQGPGIPEELHARVFERFFRIIGNKSTGSGLGLSIVQQICLIHRAKIELAKPAKTSGLIVRIFFPKIKYF